MSQRVNHQKLRLWVGSFIEFQSHVGSSGSVGLVVSRSPRHPSFGSLFTPIPARAEPKVRRRDGMGVWCERG